MSELFKGLFINYFLSSLWLEVEFDQKKCKISQWNKITNKTEWKGEKYEWKKDEKLKKPKKKKNLLEL